MAAQHQTIQLHNFQEETITSCNRFFERGFKSPLCILFTGAGKTEIFIEYINRHIQLYRERVLILMPAHLVLQTVNRFKARNPKFKEFVRTNDSQYVPAVGAVVGNIKQTNARVVITSIQTGVDRVSEDTNTILRSDFTLNNSCIHKATESPRKVLVSNSIDEILKYGMFNLLIYDEAHHSVASGNYTIHMRLQSLAEKISNKSDGFLKTIGFTATPNREDGIALNNVFDCIAVQYNFHWAIKNGYLAPVETPIRIHANVGNQKSNVLKTDNWAHVIKKAWIEKGENRPTIGYMPSVEDAKTLAAVFRDETIEGVSIPFAFIDGEGCIDHRGIEHSKKYRPEIIESMMRGETKGIVNFAVFLEGIDIPPASCMIWARNSASENVLLATQALGRFLRHFKGNEYLPEKKNALLLLATENDLSILTMGSLAGYKILDGDKFEVEKLDEDEETEVVEDLRDSDKTSVVSDGVLYSTAKLIRKSNSDWYDSGEGVLTLSISNTAALTIIYPNYTLAGYIQEVLADIETALPNVANDVQKVQLETLYQRVIKTHELLNNFTLWHVDTGVVKGDWVHADESLPMLLNYTIPYAYENGSPVDSYIARSASWKRKEPTEQQTSLLTTFKEDVKGLNRGEASQLLTYCIAWKRGTLRSTYERYVEFAKSLQQGVKSKYRN